MRVDKAARAAEALRPLIPRFQNRPTLLFAPGPSLPALWQGRSSSLPKIAIGNAHEHVPDADILYHTDHHWWLEYGPKFAGLKVSYDANSLGDVIVLEGSGVFGFDEKLGRVRHGFNSGHAALHLAGQLGGNPLVLVGYDMRAVDGKLHYFGNHRGRLSHTMNFDLWVKYYHVLRNDLGKRGIDVLCATPDSALPFPQVALDDIIGSSIAA